jgi:hypothetical protein
VARAAVILLPCALAACGDPAARELRLDLPISETDRSVVIAVHAGGRLEVYARDIDANREIAPIARKLDGAGDARVTALFYGRALTELALAEGELAPLEDGRPLPRANKTIEAEVAGGELGAWDQTIAVDPAVESFRFEHDLPCGTFTPSTIAVPAAARARLAFSLGGGAVMTAHDDGTLVWVERDREPVVLSTGRMFYDALEDPTGAIWLAGGGGEIWRGDVDRTQSPPQLALAPMTSIGHLANVLFIDGAPPNELFAVTEDRFVHHFDGTSWRTLQQINNRGRPTGIAYLSSGVALSAWGDCLCVIRHDGDSYGEIEVPANSISSNGISSILHDPSYGTIAGTFIGEILEAPIDSGVWTKRVGTYATIEVTSVVRYRDAFAYSDRRSVGVEAVAGFGYCDPLPPEQPIEIESKIAIAGDDLVVAAGVVTWWSRGR